MKNETFDKPESILKININNSKNRSLLYSMFGFFKKNLNNTSDSTKKEAKQTKFSNAMHREGEVCTTTFVFLSILALGILGFLIYQYLDANIKIEQASDLYKFIPYIPVTIACYIAFAVICRYALIYSRLSLQYRHKARLIELTDLDDLSSITKDAIYRELISIDIPEPKKQNDLQDVVDAVIKIKELSK